MIFLNLQKTTLEFVSCCTDQGKSVKTNYLYPGANNSTVVQSKMISIVMQCRENISLSNCFCCCGGNGKNRNPWHVD